MTINAGIKGPAVPFFTKKKGIAVAKSGVSGTCVEISHKDRGICIVLAQAGSEILYPGTTPETVLIPEGYFFVDIRTGQQHCKDTGCKDYK